MRTSDRFWSGPVCTAPHKTNDFDAQEIVVNKSAGPKGLEFLRKIPLVQNLMCFFGLEIEELQCERPHRLHLDYFQVADKVTKLRLYVKCKLEKYVAKIYKIFSCWSFSVYDDRVAHPL